MSAFQVASPSLESPMQCAGGLVIISRSVYPLLDKFIQEVKVLEEEDQREGRNTAHLMKLIHHALLCERAGTESDNRN